MWSSVQEQITDGTSGLAPNSGAVALVVGTSSRGGYSLLTLGKKSDISEVLGYGELPNRLRDMQKTMGDVSILALRTKGDIAGSVSPITTIGNINITLAGSPLCASEVNVSVYTEGEIGQAEVKISLTGDVERVELLPEDGIITLEDVGITLVFPLDIEYLETSRWFFETTAPTSSVEVIKEAVENALELYTPEFVFVAQSVDAGYVRTLGQFSEQLFEDHKPILFLTQTELSLDLPIAEAIAEKQVEFAKVDARFVSVVCQPLQGKTLASGLVAGHMTKAKVNQSIGATNFFAVYNEDLPAGWTNTHSRALDESRFITLRTYAGLQNLFWSNGRTMAGDKSDYRFIEVVRTVFKAIRLARRASLPYIQAPGDETGLQNLIAEVRNAIDGMTTSNPKELDDYEVEFPKGQDVVNNGVRLDISLFGIPIIRKILLTFAFKYNKTE
ncbi:MAG: DUF2586 family protein [Brevinema sp.]